MFSRETGSWQDYAAGIFVFCLLFFSGLTVVLYGRFDLGFLLLFAGIVVAIAALLYNRHRPEQTGRLITILVFAVLCAVAGISAVIILGDAVIHNAGVNPGPSSSGTRLAEPWQQPDADLLGRDLNDTAALLTEPVGGFEYGRISVSSYSPEGCTTYTLITRNLSPTTVELRVFPVEAVRSSAEHAAYEDLNVSITPDRFNVIPGQTYAAEFHVNLSSTRYDETLKLLPYYVQARTVSGDHIIADDWILVYAGGAFVPGVSGFYRGHASLIDSGRDLTVHAGGTGTATYAFQSGIGGTGFVQYNLSHISGDLNMMPMPAEEKRPFPPGMQVAIAPDKFTARSFGYYPAVITVKTAPELPPGDYHILIEADTLGTNDQFVVHVVP